MATVRGAAANPSDPIAARLRVRYAKRGRLRFTSHRDVARAFERAVRRAGIPVAHSQGFSPHPRLSWVGAAPTGAASEAEYVELALVRLVAPDVVGPALDAALPDGLDVLEIVEARRPGLADRIDASRWRIEVPGDDRNLLAEAAAAFLAAEAVEVVKVTKNGRRTIDVRAAVISLRLEDDPAPPPMCGILTVVVRLTTPVVRPDDVLNALAAVAEFEPSEPARATRMAQGRLDDGGGLADPLAADRVTT